MAYAEAFCDYLLTELRPTRKEKPRRIAEEGLPSSYLGRFSRRINYLSYYL